MPNFAFDSTHKMMRATQATLVGTHCAKPRSVGVQRIPWPYGGGGGGKLTRDTFLAM